MENENGECMVRGPGERSRAQNRVRKDQAGAQAILARSISLAIAAIGVLLLAGALAANQAWLDRHFLPLFFYSHEKFVLEENLARLGAGAMGIALIVLIRPAADRLMRRAPPREVLAAAFRIVVAVGLALLASELLLGRKFTYAAAEGPIKGEEPQRRPDPLLGWTFVPSRRGQAAMGGHGVGYVLDQRGYRVSDRAAAADPDRPAILFTGESIVAGLWPPVPRD